MNDLTKKMHSVKYFFFIVITIVSLLIFSGSTFANPVVEENEDHINIEFDPNPYTNCYSNGDSYTITLSFFHNGKLKDPQGFKAYVYKATDSSYSEYSKNFKKSSTGVWKCFGKISRGSGNAVVAAKATFGGDWFCRFEGFPVQDNCYTGCRSWVEIDWDKECYEPGDIAEITIKFYSDCGGIDLRRDRTGTLVDPYDYTVIFRHENCDRYVPVYTPSHPQTGIYKISGKIGSRIGQRIIGVYARINGIYAQWIESVDVLQDCDPCPLAIEVTQPSSNITVNQGENVNISWVGSDPKNQAYVAIYYDPNTMRDNNATLIDKPLPRSGSYTWDTSGVPIGSYYIGGEIYGECYSFDHSSGKVTIVCPTPQIPSSINYDQSIICQGESLTVSWSSSTNATGYVLQRSNYSSFIGATQAYSGSSTSYTDSPDSGTYWYRVKAKNDCGDSGWKTGSSVVVKAIPNVPVSISYPSSGCTNSSFSITWSSVSDATAYILERATNSNFSGATQVYNGSSTSYTDSPDAGTYWYRVKATNECGDSGWKNGGHSIEITVPPGQPSSLTYNGNVCQGNPVTVTWSSVSDATAYILERATNPNFSGATQVYNGSSTSYTDSPDSGTYWYRVKAKNDCGDSDWRTELSLIVKPLPEVISSISYPSSICEGGNLAVSWMSSTNATAYILERATNSNFSGATQVYNGSSTSYTDSPDAGTYWYRVKAKNDCGDSDWRTGSSVVVKAIANVPASISYPSSGCTNSSFSVTWSSVSDATAYILERATNYNFSGATQVYNGSSTSYTDSPDAGTYWYRVKAKNDCGESGWKWNRDLSLMVELSLNPISSIDYPSSICEGESIKVNWSPTNTNKYIVERLPGAGTRALIKTYSASSPPFTCTVLTPGTYWFQVKASNGCGEVVRKGSHPIVVNSCQKKKLTIKIDPLGSGDIYVDNSGPYQGGDLEFEEGQSVTLEARKRGNFVFSEWKGDLRSQGNAREKNTITINMDSNKNVTAQFAEGKAEPFILSTAIEPQKQDGSVKLDIEEGEGFIVTAVVKNSGKASSPAEYNNITFSFPEFKDSGDRDRVEKGHIDKNMEYFEYLGYESTTNQTYEYLLVEARTKQTKSWPIKEERTMSVKVFPKDYGDFTIYVRAGMGTKETWDDDWMYYPEFRTGHFDCTGRLVSAINVKVSRKEAPRDVAITSMELIVEPKDSNNVYNSPNPYHDKSKRIKIPHAAPPDTWSLNVTIKSSESYDIDDFKLKAQFLTEDGKDHWDYYNSKEKDKVLGANSHKTISLVCKVQVPDIDWKPFKRLNLKVWLEWKNEILAEKYYSNSKTDDDVIDYREDNNFTFIGYDTSVKPNTPYLLHIYNNNYELSVTKGFEELCKFYKVMSEWDQTMENIDACFNVILENLFPADNNMAEIQELNKYISEKDDKGVVDSAEKIIRSLLGNSNSDDAKENALDALASIHEGINCLLKEIGDKDLSDHINGGLNEIQRYIENAENLENFINSELPDISELTGNSKDTKVSQYYNSAGQTLTVVLNSINDFTVGNRSLRALPTSGFPGNPTHNLRDANTNCAIIVTIHRPNGAIYDVITVSSLNEIITIPDAEEGIWRFEVSTDCEEEQSYSIEFLEEGADFVFSPAVSPHTNKISPGEECTYTVSLLSLNGFDSAVDLNVEIVPAPPQGGITPTILPNPITPTGASMLRIKTSPDTTPNVYTLYFTGTAGGKSHEASALLYIADNDALPDTWEYEYFYDLDEIPEGDYDGDGLSNLDEYQQSTKPTSSDSDYDLMHDDWEVQYGLDPLDPSDADSDPDGDDLKNEEEFFAGTDPKDTDSDNDGMPDGWEVQYGLDPLVDDADEDPDKDGDSNYQECMLGTNPRDNPDGDVAPLGNRDGEINVGDALVALRFALGLETPTEQDTQHGDVAPLDFSGQPDPDGEINVGDALVILRKALGIIQF